MPNIRPYRGKRIDTKEWVFGYLIGDDVIVGEIVDWDEEYFCTRFWYKVDPETVGQYIGLKDRNGKDIYDGDLAEKSGNLYEAEYRNDMAMSMVRVIKGAVLTRGLCFGVWQYKKSESSDITELEIIGNRWEHPHLLGGKP